MEREQLKEALAKGKPLANEFEKLEKRYQSAKSPVVLSAFLLLITLTILEFIGMAKQNGVSFFLVFEKFITDPGGAGILIILNIFVIFLLFAIPIVNLITMLLVNIIGKCFFLSKQIRLKKEVNDKLDEFINSTKLPEVYCDTQIISKFIGYLDAYRADNLKECANLYNEEQKHEKLVNEIKDLKEDIQAIGEEISPNGNFRSTRL